MLRSGCYVPSENGLIELEEGVQEVSDSIAKKMCGKKFATVVIDAKAEADAKANKNKK